MRRVAKKGAGQAVVWRRVRLPAFGGVCLPAKGIDYLRRRRSGCTVRVPTFPPQEAVMRSHRALVGAIVVGMIVAVAVPPVHAEPTRCRAAIVRNTSKFVQSKANALAN